MRAEKLKAGKFDVDAPLVARLVAAQFPQWAGLSIVPVANDGWDNWTFRLGERMKVRLPSAEGYAGQAAKEAHWLPLLAPHLPFPVPRPLGVGVPGEGYPWSWTVYDWLDGASATRGNIADPVRFATDVARLLVALQAVDASGGPPPGQHSWFRGAHPMLVYGEEARRSIDALAGRIDLRTAHAVLDAAEAAPISGTPVWTHGDIAAGNLLVDKGRLSAIIDFGSSAVGDPSCDLVLAWVFLDGDARAAFRAGLPADPGLWARARAWALWKAALVFDNPVGNPAEHKPLAVIEAVLSEHRALA